MGYSLAKRVSILRKQVDDEQIGRWRLFRTVIICTLLLGLIVALLRPSLPEQNSEPPVDNWHRDIERQFRERMTWLDESPLALMPGAADIYADFGKSVATSLNTAEKSRTKEEEQALVDFEGMQTWIARSVTGALLRVGFVIIAFWPLWIIALVSAVFLVRWRFSAHPPKSVLGVCARPARLFYSGIYGPFRPNSSFSGTDFSCPGLACAPEAQRAAVLSHPIGVLLKKFNAINETNLRLAQIIVAHADFPAGVEEENPAPDDSETREIDEQRTSQLGVFTAEEGTLEQSTREGLEAVLEAHEKLTAYVRSLSSQGLKNSYLNKNYPLHLAGVEKMTARMSPLARLLATALTPNRVWAVGNLSASVVASAYLAIEAGKTLVYRRHGSSFTRISMFPHLQARAVIHSIEEYHQEYNGDLRLIIRQAIICSRRHGDFGRAFLPIRMPRESRVLRDWLEILYANKDKREDTAYLVELDAQMEEISINWRLGFSARLRQEKSSGSDNAYWKGLVYKSVVLMPLDQLVKIALRGIHDERKQRILKLLALTRKYQTRISISARLPGFKRQAMEAEASGEDSEKIVQALLASSTERNFVDYWRIVRRMLTRYNWLSTRVGDDAVPLVGLVQALLLSEDEPAVGFNALVPLRQRRFAELFGRHWESEYYAESPRQEDVDIFVDSDMFQEAVKKTAKSEEASKNDAGSVVV